MPLPYRLRIFEGGEHELRTFRTEVDQEVLSWLERFLKNDEKTPDMNLENGH